MRLAALLAVVAAVFIVHGGHGREPAWHGSTIAFISTATARLAISTASRSSRCLDGSNLERHDRDLHPYSPLAWSPDRSRIAFASGRERKRWGIYVFDLRTDGTGRFTNHILTDDRGRDRVFAGTGNDLAESAGGSRDISCGAGRDTVIADRMDRIAAGCEQVAASSFRTGGTS